METNLPILQVLMAMARIIIDLEKRVRKLEAKNNGTEE